MWKNIFHQIHESFNSWKAYISARVRTQISYDKKIRENYMRKNALTRYVDLFSCMTAAILQFDLWQDMIFFILSFR